MAIVTELFERPEVPAPVADDHNGALTSTPDVDPRSQDPWQDYPLKDPDRTVSTTIDPPARVPLRPRRRRRPGLVWQLIDSAMAWDRQQDGE
jgi:hypothetical protein